MKAYAGFSLLELLVAIAIVVGMGAAAFQLFHQNERLFRDQALILEMQQSARVVAAQIADDIRQAGQGIPILLGDVILPGSNSTRLNIRAGFSTTETVVTSPVPLALTLGSSATATIESTSGFSAGRQAFLWTENVWARVTINTVSGSTKSVRGTPTAVSTVPLVFASPPTLSLDEAIAIYRDAATQTVRRTTATNTEAPATPAWAPANELAANVPELAWVYYDASGVVLTPDTPARRAQVMAIEARVTVRSAASLSNGSRPTFTLSVRGIPRNLEGR